ncbi:MAG: sugar nucleotide-binding protein [Planctomycetota bacterium]|nr:sugar nucleotide-binding protein [Planctomycetota bacterium]
MDEEIELPADVFINPSYTVDVARAVVQLLEKDAGGIVHVVNSGEATERELAREVFRMLDMDVDVSETGEALLTGPKLPPRALLGTKKLNSEYGIKLRSWKDALRDYIRKHKDTDILLSDDIAEADTPEEQE